MNYTDERKYDYEKIIRASHTVLSESTKKLLKIILSKLDKEVTLASIVEPDNPKSLELKDFILNLADLNEYILTEIYNKDENPDAEVFFHADKFPVVSLIDDENYYRGIKFHCIPIGDSLSAFILTLYNLAGAHEAIDPVLAQKIMAIDKSADLKVCVSPSCPHCSDTAEAACKLALLNPNIQTEIIDMDLFSNLRREYTIKNVPALIINDEIVYTGPQTLEDIINHIL